MTQEEFTNLIVMHGLSSYDRSRWADRRFLMNQLTIGKVPKKKGVSPQQMKDAIIVSRWLDHEDILEFCVRDVWHKCFKIPVWYLDSALTAYLQRTFRLIPGCVKLGRKRHRGHRGKQTFYSIPLVRPSAPWRAVEWDDSNVSSPGKAPVAQPEGVTIYDDRHPTVLEEFISNALGIAR